MRSSRYALAMLALFGLAQYAGAATVSANLRIQATITNGCGVIGNTLDFGEGALAILRASPRTQATIRVSCTQGASFQVGINNGSFPTGNQRRMKKDTSNTYLSYELYKNAVGTSRFGDSVVSERVNGRGNGATPVVIPVYGQLVGTATVPAGDYADNAVITVYF